MPRAIHKLNARRVETEKAIGKYGDGGGLWLIVGKDGSKRWIFAWERDGKRREMGLHAKRLSKMRVDAITTDDVIAVLRPIWQKIPETAGRLRGRIERVLDAARAKKLIVGPWENPARWKGNLVHFHRSGHA